MAHPSRPAVLAFAVSVAAAAAARAVTLAPNPATKWPSAVYSPYLDVLNGQLPALTARPPIGGSKYFTLAFITAGTSNTQAATWGGYDSVPVSGASSSYGIVNSINSIRAGGGDVIVSFGGAGGVPIDQSVTTAPALAAQYQAVVSAYKLNAIDLDIEGNSATNAASIARRSTALAILQANNPGLKIWFSLASEPSVGLTSDGINILTSALNAGVNIGGVNLLAMDFGDYYAPNPAGKLGTYVVSAANAAHTQIKSLLAAHGQTLTDAQAWAKEGITPMIGVNDTADEVLTPTDAQQVLTFAQQKGVGYLSFWAATRDHPGTGPANESHSSTNVPDYTYTDLYTPYNTTATQWSAAAGSWGAAAGWTAGVPNHQATTVTFGPAAGGTGAGGTVTLDANRTVGHLVFNGTSGGYTVAAGTGGGTLAIDDANDPAGVTPSIVVNGGSHAISAPVTLANGVAVSAAAGANLTLSGVVGGAGGLAFTGPGGLHLEAVETYAGSTSVTGGTLTLDAGGKLPATTALSVNAGGTLVAAGTSLVRPASLALAGTTGAWTGKVDLGTTDLDLPAGVLATVTNQVAQGYANGTWAGTGGLTSSAAAADPQHLTALGVVQNVNAAGTGPLLTTFDGQAVTTADVLVRDTYYGDANLDGVVNAADYAFIDAGFLNHASGWANGDFNSDGTVDGSDYTLIDNAYNTQAGLLTAFGAATAADLVAASTAEVAVADAPAVALPEPASLALVAVAAAGLGRRRTTRG